MDEICTSIEQSKKLIELGIDANTADMCWTNHLFDTLLSSWRIESTSPQEYKNLLDRFAIKGYLIEPAWSLSALLELIPNNYILRNSNIGTHKYNIWIPIRKSPSWHSTPLDAAFEMVVWLKENKKI